VTQFWWKWS